MIIVDDVWKKYGKQQVLEGLSLVVPEKKIMVIIGRSGVGKSVLLRQIVGLERPDKGSITIHGIPITELDEENLYTARRNIGMVFQSSALFDSLSVGENVAFYLNLHPEKDLTQDMIKGMVHESLKKVGLENFEDKMPAMLSGGQRRRVALARAIFYEPKVVLYDEPTTGLDPITARHISELIQETHNDLGATSLIVTHDMSMALQIADLFALHEHGKISYTDTKESFKNSKNPLIQEFLENAFM